MFSVLAIDWGKSRCGIAFAQPATGLIIPYSKPCDTAFIWTTLETEIQTRKISTIVLGLPTNFSGQDTEVTTQIRNFANKFQQRFAHLKIHFVNERGSSKIAKNQLSGAGDAHSINHLAAVDIAARWLERNPG